MASSVQVKGLRELNAALADLPRNIGRNVLRGAVRAGAVVVRDEAKVRAPVVTGQLRRALYMKQIREQSNALRQVFYVGVRAGKAYRNLTTKGGKDRSMDAYYAKFVEYGHFSRRSTGRGFAKIGYRRSDRGQRNNELLAGEVQSGAVRWIAARPFMRPAWDARKEDALKALAAYLEQRIPQEVAKSRK
jgi:HK97 gp10 family phage protein